MEKALGYLEIATASGCNLKCRGCSHFSNIVERTSLVTVKEFHRDMARLSEIVPFIYTIRLLGGEPLLNPDIDRLAEEGRRYYPESHIWIVTNGLLLPKLSEEKLTNLAKCGTEIQISMYPPTLRQMPDIARVLDSHKIKYSCSDPITVFRKRMNLHGNSEPEFEFQHCPVGKDCHYLDRGKLSVCPAPQVASVLEDRFGLDMKGKEEDILDIHDPEVTFDFIERFLAKTPSMCRFCTKPVLFDWETAGKPALKDWIVEGL